jgi:serine/threonine protein kinase
VRHAVPLEPGLEPIPGCRLRQRIGSGGFAEVWQAEARDGTLIALKFMRSDSNLDAVAEIRSAQAIQQLRHPNLIRIIAVCSCLGYIVIAMEQADGSLADLLEVYQSECGTPVPCEQLCLLMEQAAAALDFLNTRQHHIGDKVVGFQHCDVKPRNLLLFGDTVKLTDFGLASEISCQLKWHRRAGTLDYTPPEVFQGRLSNWTDQYSLAVTYCELRGGRLPFPDTPATFRHGYVRPAPDLSMLPPEEQPIIARALAPIPQNRWPNCRQMVEQLMPLMV